MKVVAKDRVPSDFSDASNEMILDLLILLRDADSLQGGAIEKSIRKYRLLVALEEVLSGLKGDKSE